jgi:uncharacterized protein YhbP (UPF0306 family)
MPLDRQLWQQIDEFLATWRTASLATVDDQGRPHAANIWYACAAVNTGSDQPRPWPKPLFFVSNPDSAHSLHLARRPEVALTIYAHTDQAQQIHGLQMHGLCHMIEQPSERDQAMQIFSVRFPELATSPAILGRLESERFYRIDVTWLRWIDNRRGFGFKVEMACPVRID